MTVATEDLDTAFKAALARDAGASVPPEVPAPPRVERDPEAPHGRAEDGSPVAPFGLKADGTPRLKPAGPGRPKAADRPRVIDTPSPSASAGPAKGDGTDYTADLMGLGTSVWLGASSIRGGKLLGVKLPDVRPYAAVWHAQLPQMAAAWNAAAQQNATVRGYVRKLSGDGSWSWVIGVGITAAGLAAGIAELARAPQEVRDQAAAVNDQRLGEFIGTQVKAMGLEVPE